MPLQKEIQSPLVKKSLAVLYSSIDPSDIIERYKDEVGMNVSTYFDSVQKVGIYRCKASNYLFYYPYHLAGDGQFYKELSENVKDYYPTHKREFDLAASFLSPSDEVLEIGCGDGFFLDLLKSKGFHHLHGLELNTEAALKAVKKGHDVSSDQLEEVLNKKGNTYDAVLLFQVLEHVSEVYSLLESVVKLLKPGGKLVIAVPYNNPYYAGRDKFQIMNLPPHHMGLWSPESLNRLADFFPLQVIHREFEAMPLRNIGYRLRLTVKNIFKGKIRQVIQNIPADITFCGRLVMKIFGKKDIYHNQIFIFRKNN